MVRITSASVLFSEDVSKSFHNVSLGFADTSTEVDETAWLNSNSISNKDSVYLECCLVYACLPSVALRRQRVRTPCAVDHVEMVLI